MIRPNNSGGELEKSGKKIIQILLTIGIPFLSFFFCWWSAGFLLKSGLITLSEREIATDALFGLFIGILITIFYLKKLTNCFYLIYYWTLFIIYLFISAIAFAMFMGFPIGLLALGALSGLYIGRRSKQNRIPYMFFSKIVKKLSMLNAMIIGTCSSLTGIMALKETNLLKSIQFLGLKPDFFTGNFGILFVSFLTIVLMFFQFWITWKSALSGYR